MKTFSIFAAILAALLLSSCIDRSSGPVNDGEAGGSTVPCFAVTGTPTPDQQRALRPEASMAICRRARHDGFKVVRCLSPVWGDFNWHEDSRTFSVRALCPACASNGEERQFLVTLFLNPPQTKVVRRYAVPAQVDKEGWLEQADPVLAIRFNAGQDADSPNVIVNSVNHQSQSLAL